jgi:hypothetical protein
MVEFPHLEAKLGLKDVALVINLWEDKEGRLTTLHRTDGGGKQRQARREEEIRATEKRKGRR